MFAFVNFLAMLYISSLGTKGAVIFTALVIAYGAVRFAQLREILAPRAVILVIPAFAILSVLWSEARTETLKYSIEFALTVGAGLLLSAAPRPKAVLWGMFPAFAIYVITALAFGGMVAMGDDGAMAFSGLTESKNLFGDIASYGLLISLACFVAAIEDRRLFRSLLALAVAAVHGYALIEARSAGALIGIAAAIACFIFFLALRPLRLPTRIITTGFTAICASLMIVAFGSTVIEDAMTMFDKDPTLTGRTYLWERAGDFIADNPVLGKGFAAFWLHGNPDAEGLWEYAGITSRSGFNFHNTVIEILVHLGWLGLFVLGTTAIIVTLILFYRVMTRPTLSLCFWVSILAYDAARLSVESIGLTPFAHSTVMLFAAFGSAFAARQFAPAAKPIGRTRQRALRFEQVAATYAQGPFIRKPRRAGLNF